MTTRLIVNADDYGRTVEVSRGIRHAHLHGIVTSTTAMMNMPGVENDLKLALEETPGLGLGVHLVLTTGRPLLPPGKACSLTDEKGDFLKLLAFTAQCHTLVPVEVENEWRAQIEKFIGITGRAPTHLDSHHHASYFTQDLFQCMLELSTEYGCSIRMATVQVNGGSLVGLPPELHDTIMEFSPRLLGQFKLPTPQGFIATFYDELAAKIELLKIIDELPAGVFELMCHPGYVDLELIESTSYALQREVELSILTDPDIRKAIEGRGIELVSFGGIGIGDKSKHGRQLDR